MVYSTDRSFSYGSKLPTNLIAAIMQLRDDRKAGQFVTTTAVMVDYDNLPNGKLAGVFIGGFGADTEAPAVFQRTWVKSDLIGGVYYHPRIPSIYMRKTFLNGFQDLDIVKKLQVLIKECECDDAYTTDPAFMLWSLLQIFG